MVIVLCELLEGGRVKPRHYLLQGITDTEALEIVLRNGRTALQDLKHPCWIEAAEHPASLPSLETAARKINDKQRAERTGQDGGDGPGQG